MAPIVNARAGQEANQQIEANQNGHVAQLPAYIDIDAAMLIQMYALRREDGEDRP